MAVQQLIWIVLIGAVLIVGFPVKSPDTANEDDRLNYEKYVRQLEKKHKFAYNDIDQPWQPISDNDSDEDDSHEIVLKVEESVSVQPLVKDEVKKTSQSPVLVADPAPVAPVIKAEETPAAQVTKAEEVSAVTVTKAEETPVATVTKAEEAPAVDVTKAEETPAITAIKAEETPATTVTAVEEIPSESVTKTEEAPSVTVSKSEETLVITVTKAEESPAVVVTKAEDTLLVAPVAEAEKAPQVADAISETVATVAEDEVAATTTHEKLLADLEDDSVPATTTQEKLLAAAADEVEGSGQSDPAADVESVTIGQANNEPIEDSTFSVLHESATNVAQIDVTEGSTDAAAVQLQSDSVTINADEGSGQSDSADIGSGQFLSNIGKIFADDEGSGAADISEGSGLGDELIKEIIDHTIQPEISNDAESSTGTHSDLHLSDDLANDSSSSTTEPPTTAGWKDGEDENKEVKSTDTPTADEVAAVTEIQPSSTVRSVQAEDSTEVVVADSTDAVNVVRQESASDSTDRPEENATFLSVPVDDQVADEANNNATEKNDDSHSTPSDV
ncbi:fibrous sheath CABYR-binding protein-like isoform X2 [Daphnia pulicaria]|uniref:fibrous sheath CABYR-binding protein-like isoform X2 n=1 Tax=Daphnia pulicaria TaxID=35523 RepID=UPI001EEC0F82|nr:fibrous sheath CABYR-binding protein-like isoform X2 [Daphnia pulicaria]